MCYISVMLTCILYKNPQEIDFSKHLLSMSFSFWVIEFFIKLNFVFLGCGGIEGLQKPFVTKNYVLGVIKTN